jgi:hypothetical protein
MTQERINRYFLSSLGVQCDFLFSTPDDRVFIRRREAIQHCIDNNLDSKNIEMWFNNND